MRHACCIHYSVLFLLTFITANTLASNSVTAKLHQSATLSCNNKCSGVVTWAMFHNPGNILAQCNKTKCWSEKGYEVSHDKYLKGKFLLTITAVDYSNRIIYTCACDGVDAYEVRLIVETLTSLVQLNPGEALVMDLPIPEPVEVMYKARDSADLYGAQICTVTQRSLHCRPEYTHRASLSYPNITLRDVNMTDSGTYSIRDRKNEEVIHIYTLIVNVVRPQSVRKCYLEIGVSVVLSVLVIIVGIFVMKNQHKKSRNREETGHMCVWPRHVGGCLSALLLGCGRRSDLLLCCERCSALLRCCGRRSALLLCCERRSAVARLWMLLGPSARLWTSLCPSALPFCSALLLCPSALPFCSAMDVARLSLGCGCRSVLLLGCGRRSALLLCFGCRSAVARLWMSLGPYAWLWTSLCPLFGSFFIHAMTVCVFLGFSMVRFFKQ